MTTIAELEGLLDYANKTNAVGFKAGDDIRKAMLGWEFLYHKQRLNTEQLEYLCQNYDVLQKLKVQGNLSTHRLSQFIRFFHKNNTDLTTVVFNKKVQITEAMCRKKIIDTLKYDFDSSSIKIGNIGLTVCKRETGVYSVHQYVGKELARNDGNLSSSGYNLLFILDIPGLTLLPVDW